MPYRDIDEPVVQQWMLRFGAALQAARRSAGLSQEQLATRSGLPQSTISRLEHGLTPYVSLTRIGRLSIGLDGRIPIGPCPHGHECAWSRPLVEPDAVRRYRLRRQHMAAGIIDPTQLAMLEGLAIRSTPSDRR